MPEAVSNVEFNPRVASMKPSATLAMTGRAMELRRQGKPVIGLSAGEPDFNTPDVIAKEGIQAINDGFTNYTQNMGMPELREEIQKKLARDNGLAYGIDQILCSNGAKQSVALAISTLCRPGDEVLIPAPYWVSYPEMTRFAGGTPVALPTTVEQDYRVDAAALERAITPNTRIFLLCSPSNPTGSVYSKEELEAIAEVMRRHEHVFILSDEIYEYVIFDAEHTSFASLAGMKERTITVNGFSKGFAMTGWRLGYMAGPKAIVKTAAKIQGQFTSAPSSITQRAGVAALQMDKSELTPMVDAFRSRRDYMLNELKQIPGVRCPKPEGAFYLFPEVSGFFGKTSPQGKSIQNSEDLCFYLLEEHHVALVPGSAFGDPNGLRISYAASQENLEEAMRRIKTGLSALR
ncbi:MAG: pyridoxal phosphate-dependent aminotransferase [Rhodothermales bacterium]